MVQRLFGLKINQKNITRAKEIMKIEEQLLATSDVTEKIILQKRLEEIAHNIKLTDMFQIDEYIMQKYSEKNI